MTKIVFYEATGIDSFQLSEALSDSDFELVFIDDIVTLDNAASDADAISVFVDSHVSREVLEKMPNLKLIATRSTGFNHIDLEVARARGITVSNVPSYGENTVAEHAIALLLMLTRKMNSTLTAVRRGTYVASEHSGIDLHGRTLGLIGAGRIGQHVARIARGFGMNVLAFDTYENVEVAEEIGFRYAPFDEVISQADILSLHTPLTPSDFHMINEGTIARMKKGVFLINTARGELVENRALINALQRGHIAAAGLDTIEGEQFLQTKNVIDTINSNAPNPDDYRHIAELHTLASMKNVVLTPHSAFNTTEAIERINRATAKNITAFYAGEPTNTVQETGALGRLVVVRHGESEWNLLGKWTGTTDVHLTPAGIAASAELGKKLTDIQFDYAYISEQIRTKETIEALQNGSGQFDLRYEASVALNERDYGVYTGMNKDQIKKIVGDSEFQELRRSWDGPVEDGESLKDVYQRVIPFYLRVVLPRLRHGQDILIVAHGNSIRSLVKYLENISDEAIGEVEMLQKSALVYQIASDGRSQKKDVITL